jgi:hypothetical protein
MSDSNIADEQPAFDAVRYPAAIERFAVSMVAAFEALPFSHSSTSVRSLRASLAELRSARAEISQMLEGAALQRGESLSSASDGLADVVAKVDASAEAAEAAASKAADAAADAAKSATAAEASAKSAAKAAKGDKSPTPAATPEAESEAPPPAADGQGNLV